MSLRKEKVGKKVGKMKHGRREEKLILKSMISSIESML